MSILDEDQEIDPIAYVRDKFKIAADAQIDPALAKSKYESDKYIQMMEKQKDQLANDYLKLKADYDARASLEEMLNQKLSQETVLPSTNETKPINPVDIEKLVDSRLSSYEKQKKVEENIKKTKELLREKLGNNYSNTLKNKMEELELTQEELDTIAARSPKLFMRTLGLDQAPPQVYQNLPSSTFNSANFKPVQEDRTWSWYQDLKVKDPQAWLNPKIQTQMYHDAQRLGPKFADGDFNQYNERLNP